MNPVFARVSPTVQGLSLLSYPKITGHPRPQFLHLSKYSLNEERYQKK